jgi:hypothetical protein
MSSKRVEFFKCLHLIIGIFTVASFSYCGDLFAYKRNITGKYYLLGLENNGDLAIYRETKDGDLLQRIPPKIIEYGFNDSFLVAKYKMNGITGYYVINKLDDSDYAETSDYLVDSLIIESDYLSKWKERLNINFRKIK